MMPPDSSQSMSPLAGGLALHPDRTTLPDRKNVKDSQSDSTRDMRMRGDRITRTTYNREMLKPQIVAGMNQRTRRVASLWVMTLTINSRWRSREIESIMNF